MVCQVVQEEKEEARRNFFQRARGGGTCQAVPLEHHRPASQE